MLDPFNGKAVNASGHHRTVAAGIGPFGAWLLDGREARSRLWALATTTTIELTSVGVVATSFRPHGIGNTVVDLIFSMAKREVTFLSGTAAIRRL